MSSFLVFMFLSAKTNVCRILDEIYQEFLKNFCQKSRRPYPISFASLSVAQQSRQHLGLDSRRVYYAQIFCKIQYVCDTIYGHFSWQYSILDICHSYFILEPRFGDFNFSWGKSRTFTYLIERSFKQGRWNWGNRGIICPPTPFPFFARIEVMFFFKFPHPPFFDLPPPLKECRIR